jgi:hypothetical protein
MTFTILPALRGSFGLTHTDEMGFTGRRPPTRHDQVFGRTALAMSTSSIRRLRSDVSRASAR